MWREQNVKWAIKEKADGKNDDISSDKMRMRLALQCVCAHA